MPDYLALEWDSDKLSGLLATVGPGTVRVKKSIQFGRPDGWSGFSPAESGAWLKDRLLEVGVRCDRVLVSLPRADVVMKRLEVPDVPDDELPVLVKFQAAAKAAQPLDDLYLDFLPSARREGLPREVLVVTCPKVDGEKIRATCTAAGLQVETLGVTPVALGEVVARVETGNEDPQAATIVITRHGPRLEIFVLRQGVLIFSHATRLPEDLTAHHQLQATIGEVSRATVSLRNVHANLKLGQGWLLADPGESVGLISALRNRLGCDVELLDPFSTVALEHTATEPVDVSWFAGPIGMLLARSGARGPGIDFLNPRKPPVRRDVRRQRLIQAGIGVAAGLVLFLGWYGWEYRRLSALIEEQVREDQQLAEYNKAGEAALKSADAIGAWSKSEVAWLDQMKDLSQRLPGTDRIYVSKLELARSTLANNKDTLGHVNIEGFAREQKDVTSLGQTLLAEGSPYHMLPPEMRVSKDEPYYKLQFKSQIVIDAPRADAKKIAVAAAARPPVSPASGSRPAEASKPKNDSKKPESPPARDKSPARPASAKTLTQAAQTRGGSQP